METLADAALVTAAQSGDRTALDALLTDHLPLVYNLVGRALGGHADVDDVVQEVMLRVVQGLPGLRDPERFRSWLLSITIHQTQDWARRLSRGPGAISARQLPLDEAPDVADPSPDFVDLTNDRLRLAQEQREVVQASRWLNAAERRVLELWWQEVAGSISRAEVAAALALSLPHTAVRIQRMKAHLELARELTRAWRASPRCPELGAAAASWDRQTNSRWFKRLGRHVRECPVCVLAARDITSTEQVLSGLGSVPVPLQLFAVIPSLTAAAATHGWLTTHAVIPMVHAVRRVLHLMSAKPTILLGAGVASVTVVASMAVYYTEPDTLQVLPPAPAPAASAPAPALTPTPVVAPLTPSATAAVSPSPANAVVTVQPAGVDNADIFVAPAGNDANAGTAQRPLATLAAAVARVRPGQTIALRGGTYQPTTAAVIATSGTEAARITVSNLLGEHPVIDASRIPADEWYITQTANYWTVQGLEIANSPSHALVCQSCRSDIFRRLSIHDSGDTAITLRGDATVGNEIADSDFYHNHDTIDHGGSADGLAIKSGSGTGNLVRGCRVYENSGDGLDLTDFTDPVTLTSVWAYGNGVNRWNIADFTGPGNGIKLGGGSPAPAVNHVVTNSVAWDNAGYGFTEASNRGRLVLTRNTAYRNGVTGFAFFFSSSVMRQNLALANQVDVNLGDTVDDQANSWNQAGWATTDLRSGDPATARAARPDDGTLPATTFLVNRRDPTMGASMK